MDYGIYTNIQLRCEGVRHWLIPIKTIANGDPMQMVNYLIQCTLRIRTEKQHKIRKKENHDRTKDDTNKIRDMSKYLTSSTVIQYLRGGHNSPYLTYDLTYSPPECYFIRNS